MRARFDLLLRVHGCELFVLVRIGIFVFRDLPRRNTGHSGVPIYAMCGG